VTGRDDGLLHISEIVMSIHLTETYITKGHIPGMAFVISRALSSAGHL
jgi:hypothetical protein